MSAFAQILSIALPSDELERAIAAAYELDPTLLDEPLDIERITRATLMQVSSGLQGASSGMSADKIFDLDA